MCIRDRYSTYQCRHLDAELIHLVEDGMTTDIAGYRVRSFLKPHDAREPMGFKVDGSSASAAFVMDLGYVPPSAEHLLRGAEYLVFESNHDLDMEINSDRPDVYKRQPLDLSVRVLNPAAYLMAAVPSLLTSIFSKRHKELPGRPEEEVLTVFDICLLYTSRCV